MEKSAILLGLVFGTASVGQVQAQTAGVIQFVAGDVRLAQARGGERAARKGVPVSVGDMVMTPSGGLAQLKMDDGAIVVVQPESRLTLVEFHYSGQEDGTEKVRYRLERGGFRAVTGAIGRTHKMNYVIETPIAHMGVRGTDHESYYFPATGPVSGDGAKPGAYNKVNTGMTFIRTDVGEVEIWPNEVGYVASADRVPVILPTLPGFFNRSIAPLSARPSVNPVSRGAPVVVSVNPVSHAAPVVLVEQSVASAQGQQLIVRGPKVDGGGGMGPFVGYALAVGARSFAHTGAGLQVVPNGATLANMGGDAAWDVNWGSWQGGLATVGGDATLGSTHVIQSSAMTSAATLAALAPGLVTAKYSYVGGPAPTNQAGVQGSVNSLTVGVNFSTQSITSYALDASVGTANWKASGNGSIAQFTGASGIELEGTCANCVGKAPASRAIGTAQGGFVGTAAEKMISTYGLTSGNQTLTGAAYLSR